MIYITGLLGLFCKIHFSFSIKLFLLMFFCCCFPLSLSSFFLYGNKFFGWMENFYMPATKPNTSSITLDFLRWYLNFSFKELYFTFLCIVCFFFLLLVSFLFIKGEEISHFFLYIVTFIFIIVKTLSFLLLFFLFLTLTITTLVTDLLLLSWMPKIR